MYKAVTLTVVAAVALTTAGAVSVTAGAVLGLGWRAFRAVSGL